jgi:Tfp pilus assembly protein PilN
MRAVNLLPRESLGRNSGSRRIDPVVAGGAALTLVVVAALGGGFVLEHSHASAQQQKLASARAELVRLEAASHRSSGGTTPVLPSPAVTQQQAPWQAALTSALSTRVAWDDVLTQLSRVVPSNVTVATVSLGGSSAGSGTLSLGGVAFSEEGVAQLLARLGLVPTLGNITLTASSADPKTGHVTFTITADVSTPTPPASIAAPATGGVAS